MKKVEFGKEARKNLVKGIDTLADAVVSTLGPNGRNVVIGRGIIEAPLSTKDGVTVAKNIVLKEIFITTIKGFIIMVFRIL